MDAKAQQIFNGNPEVNTIYNLPGGRANYFWTTQEGAEKHIASLPKEEQKEAREALQKINRPESEEEKAHEHGLPEESPTEDWTNKQITEWLESNQKDLGGASKKADLLALVGEVIEELENANQ